MKTTIDAAGRVVIPKRLRDRFGLRGGAELELEGWEDRIEIRRAPREAPLVEDEHGILTTDPAAGLPGGYGPDAVRELLAQTRR